MTNVSNSTITNLCNDIKNHVQNDGVTYSKDELETLFANTQYFNAGEDGKEELQKQIDALTKTIDALKKEADDLEKQIEKKNLDVDDTADTLAELATKINKETSAYQKDMKDAAKQAAYDAIAAYKAGNGETSYEVCYESAFKAQLGGMGLNMSALTALYKEYDAIKSGLTPVLQTIEGLLGQVNGLQTKLNSTNATINLLTQTRDNMNSRIKGAYKNVDTDANIPMFSGDKADIANGILAKYTSRTDTAGDTAAKKTATEEAKDWASKNDKNASTGSDIYNASQNKQLANLNQCVKDGMIDNLKNSGMSADDIMKYVNENWNVGISFNKDTGNWVIPYGHGSDKTAYNALRGLIQGDAGKEIKVENVNQTQLAELQKAVGDGIIKDMYDAGFTFKEMMYTLTKAFPDAGIVYDLNSQTKGRNYQTVQDNDKTGTFFADLRKDIKAKWNVGADDAKTGGSTSGKTEGKDPISFQIGETTYTFITDRNNDGKFDYTNGDNNELLGSENGIQELLDLATIERDSNGNIISCKVEGEALKGLMLIANKQEESVNNGNDVEKYKDGSSNYTNSVDFNVSYTSAEALGIESLDLTAIAKAMESGSETTGKGEDVASSTRGYDNVQEGFEDINGSSIINQFSVKMSNGDTITANETLNSEANLETFYKQIADKSGDMYSNISDAEFEAAWGKWSSNDAKGVNDKLDAMKTKLEGLKKKAQEKGSPDDYELSHTLEDLVEIYGSDGMSGSYYKTVKERAINASDKYAQQEKNGVNTGHGLDDVENSNSGLAAKEIDKSLDEYNKNFPEVTVVKKGEKKE